MGLWSCPAVPCVDGVCVVLSACEIMLTCLAAMCDLTVCVCSVYGVNTCVLQGKNECICKRKR